MTTRWHFLREELANGRQLVDDLKAAAGDEEITAKTLRRAREELGIEAEREEFGGPYYWSLPLLAHGPGATMVDHDDGQPRENPHHERDSAPSETPEKPLLAHPSRMGKQGPKTPLEAVIDAKPPPRPWSVYTGADFPDWRLRVMEIQGEQVQVRVEAWDGNTGKEMLIPIEHFGSNLTRVS